MDIDGYIRRGKEIIKKYNLSANSSPETSPFRILELMKDITPVAVLLGQDPYPQKNMATGIAFANFEREGVPISPSLRVIEDSVRKFEPEGIFDVTLEWWVGQGILPINAAWTVQHNNPASHIGFWVNFTMDFIKDLSGENPGMFYALLGRIPSMFEPCIQNAGMIYQDFHPSYYARSRTEMSSNLWKMMSEFVKERFNKTIKFMK